MGMVKKGVIPKNAPKSQYIEKLSGSPNVSESDIDKICLLISGKYFQYLISSKFLRT